MPLNMDFKVLMILISFLNYGSIVQGGYGCVTCSKGLEQKCCQRYALCCILQTESNNGTALLSTPESLSATSNETQSSTDNLPSSTSGALLTSTDGPSSKTSTLSSLSYAVNETLPSSNDEKLEREKNETIRSTKSSERVSSNHKKLLSTKMMVDSRNVASATTASTSASTSASTRASTSASRRASTSASRRASTSASTSASTTASTSKPRWGRCPADRFTNMIVTRTVCLRRTCSFDSDCNFIQKCCPYGETKCCVYPLYI